MIVGWCRALCVLLGAAWLAGCASTVPGLQPTPLEEIDRPADSFRIAWRVAASSNSRYNRSSFVPAVADGIVYASSARGEVAAFRSDDGSAVWKIGLDRALTSGVSVDNQSLYLATRDGSLLALDRELGQARWESKINREVLRAPLTDAGQILLSTSSGEFYALDIIDGSERWNFRYKSPDLTVRGAGSSAYVPGGYFAALEDGRLVALDERDGGLIWEHYVSTPRGRTPVQRIVDIDAAPLLIGVQVVVGSRRGDVHAIDGRTGEQIWAQAVDSVAGLAGGEDALVVIQNDSTLVGLSTATGESLWRSEALRGRQLGTPTWHRGRVLVGDLDGYLHAIDPNSGNITGRVQIGDAPVVAPVLALGDDVIVQDQAGKLVRVAMMGGAR